MEEEEEEEVIIPIPVTKPPSFASDIIENAWKMVGLDVYPPSDDTFMLLRVRRFEILR